MTAAIIFTAMRRALLLCLCAAVLAVAAAGCGDDDGSSARQQSPALLRVTSSAFINRTRLPSKYTCDGAGEEPSVQAGASPVGTSELVLVMSDLDAPGGSFVHVTRYGLSPSGKASVSEGGREGRNSRGTVGWTPPCPPGGDGVHRYVWSVYAVDEPTDLPTGAEPDEVLGTLGGDNVLAKGTIEAQYAR